MKPVEGSEYTLQEIVQHTSIPVLVKKSSWSDDFQFRVERVEGQTVYGTAFKNGKEHHRKFGPDYSYILSDRFVYLGKPFSRAAEDKEAERLRRERELEQQKQRQANEEEMLLDQKESNLELSKVEVSDIIRVQGSLTEKDFISDLLGSDGQVSVIQDENNHLANILAIIRRVIRENKDAKTTPQKPFWYDSETGPRGILDSVAMQDYVAEAERNRKIDQILDDMRKAEQDPYFCHVLLKFNDESDTEDIFIGQHLVYHNSWPAVISWKSKLGGLAYEKDRLQINLANRVTAEVQFRREVDIKGSKLINAIETYNRKHQLGAAEQQLVYDTFLLELLKRKRAQKELTNIIPSIQRNQYQIIKAPATESLVVQGCAGSGKTMILLHRISYLLYNEPRFRPQDYLVISPSVQFNKFIQSLVADLELTHVAVKALPEYYVDYLTAVNSGWKEIAGDGRLYSNAAQPESYISYLYSEQYMNALKERVPARIQSIKNNENAIQNLAARRKEMKNQNLDSSALSKEIERRKRLRRVSIFDAEFIDLIPDSIKPGNRKIPICKAELYATALLNYFCYGTKKSYPLIFVDEGQDLASCEYELLRSMNQRAVMNIYGDIDQRINNYSIESWDVLKTVGTFSRYSINENYRNTVQIGTFVNDELMKNMTVLGLDGPEVIQVPAKQLTLEKRAFPKDRKAIIYKDPRLLSRLKENTDGYELLTVNEAKGMEFETVFVIMNGLNDNEWYVACTRALNKLYMLDVRE